MATYDGKEPRGPIKGGTSVEWLERKHRISSEMDDLFLLMFQVHFFLPRLLQVLAGLASAIACAFW